MRLNSTNGEMGLVQIVCHSLMCKLIISYPKREAVNFSLCLGLTKSGSDTCM